MACKSCPIPGCEVLIVGARDLCGKHFMALPASQQKRLDELRGATAGSPNAIRYRAELEAAISCLERKARASQRALAEPGYPASPVPA